METQVENINIDLEECYSWYKLPKLEQIKTLHAYILSSVGNLIAFELNIREWKLLTESVEILTLDEALEKFKESTKKSWLHKWFNIL